MLLSDGTTDINYLCVGVKDTSADFLQYLDKQNIALGSKIKIISIETFDASLHIKINHSKLIISNKIAENIFIKKMNKKS